MHIIKSIVTLYMANTNRFQGLARGPIDHKSTSIINAVSNGLIQMGSVVITSTADITTLSTILPKVDQLGGIQGSHRAYGIAVGGDIDGTYNDGSASTDDADLATNDSDQGVVIVTQGRCLARVGGSVTVNIGDPLTMSATVGILEIATTGDNTIAYALNKVTGGDLDMIAVDVQREGALET